MKLVSHTFQAVALSLLLVLTGQAMAQAAGTPPAVGEMVICTGHGPQVIYVDTEGAPTNAPYVCPDCALSALQGVLDQGIVQAGAANWRKVRCEIQTGTLLCPNSDRPQARDPPWQL